MKDRIHIVLPLGEKERYRAIAEREGTTLSSWIRDALRERASKYDVDRKLDTADDLEAFFRECDELHGNAGETEPDWDDHERLIHEARAQGLESRCSS